MVVREALAQHSQAEEKRRQRKNQGEGRKYLLELGLSLRHGGEIECCGGSEIEAFLKLVFCVKMPLQGSSGRIFFFGR